MNALLTLAKYTSWTAGYVQEMMATYIQNPSVFTDDFNIPESNNGIPDILDEAKWGLDWLKRMQNSDGWPLQSWSISENSNGYQLAYIRLLARFVK